jgi:hypothetical protein
VAGGGGPGARSSGEAQVLERRGRRGVGTEGTSGAARAGSEWLSGSAAEGKEEGKGGGPKRGGATWRGGAVGPGPDRRTAPDSGPSAALAGDVRRARACRPDIAGERGI